MPHNKITLIMETNIKRHRRFSHENETNEFYNGGTLSEAQKVKKELEEQFNKEGTIDFDTVYGWYVRVRKLQNN